MSKKKKAPMERERQRDKTDKALLRKWQDRLAYSKREFDPQAQKMDEREAIYNGRRELTAMVTGGECDGPKQTSHVRNVVYENIESMVSSTIPQPKVTPLRKEDEHLADLIERFLRNELDRLPFEAINDMAERTVPIQGGVGYLVEWDNSKRTHNTVGEVTVSLIHPKQFAPQPGVFGSLEDMDWFIVKLPTTKETVRRKYGVSVYNESESEPELRGPGSQANTDEAVTQYIGFEVAPEGWINRYSWVNDVELENLIHYQARRQPVCTRCGRTRPTPGQVIANSPVDMGQTEEQAVVKQAAGQMLAQALADQYMDPASTSPALMAMEQMAEPKRYDGGGCPWCGCEKFEDREREFEEMFLPMDIEGGLSIPGAEPGLDDLGNAVMKPTLVPYYKPDLMPIVLQKSVSIFGQLLGNSDVDAIADQQNTINRIEQKIIDRLMAAGTRVTLPNNGRFTVDAKDHKVWRISDPKDKTLIGVYEFKGNLEYELTYLAQVYEESRQILGINDSFQGRRDPTATSGKAKEFSAAQTAGRLESKRVMKNTAYAAIFERMFKNWLAYADEPRPIHYTDMKGNQIYEEFNRYQFLRKDANGQYYWNDQFLFSVDTNAPLERNREAMWQECRMNLQTGAFGNPQELETLVLFWTKMEQLHYPGAGDTKKLLEDRLQQQQALLRAQAAASTPGGQVPGTVPQPTMNPTALGGGL